MARGLDVLGSLQVEGSLEDTRQVSALALHGDRLYVGTDESNRLQVLRRGDRPDQWVVDPTAAVSLADADGEIDVEALALDGDVLYATGSHAATRPRWKAEKAYQRNRRSLDEPIHPADPLRERMFRVRLGGDPAVAHGSAAAAIRSWKVFEPFIGLPSKENGIDIEGLAVRAGRLHFGFRGPVLRGNHVPLLSLVWGGDPSDSQLRFVRLDGLGIRDMAAVDDGFLVLAGPVGDAPGPFALWHWDGEDMLPGHREGGEREGRAVELGAVAGGGDRKPEAIAVIATGDDGWELIMGFDGPPAGGLQRCRVARPG